MRTNYNKTRYIFLLLLIVMQLCGCEKNKEPQTRVYKPINTPSGNEAVDVVIINKQSIYPRNGYAYQVAVPISADDADSLEHPDGSQWLLMEDGLYYGQGHNIHADIESYGEGRYSHWKKGLIFSAYDNSNPITNDRVYKLVKVASRNDNSRVYSGLDPILMLNESQTLSLCGETIIGSFEPPFGKGRQCINPAAVNTDNAGWLHFENPGEYYLYTTEGAIRVLVLEDDKDKQGAQIVAFVSANVSGADTDHPQEPMDWDAFDSFMYRRIFYSDVPLDVACGDSSRVSLNLLKRAEITGRQFTWYGIDDNYNGHTGLELSYTDHHWQYFDTHFGFTFKGNLNGLQAVIQMNSSDNIPMDMFVTLVDKGDWIEPYLQPGFRSLRSSVRLDDPDTNIKYIYRFNNSDELVYLRDKPVDAEIVYLRDAQGLDIFTKLFYE